MIVTKLNIPVRVQLHSNKHVRRYDPIGILYYIKALILKFLKDDIGSNNRINKSY